MDNPAAVKLESACKVYPNGVAALKDVSLLVEPGQYITLLGTSGCGKTTLLRAIAGLETLSAGSVHLGGILMNHVAANRRGVAMAFQRPVLLPGKTVRDNMLWACDLRQYSATRVSGWFAGRERNRTQERELMEMAEILGLAALLTRRAGELSGGQQQRVALGRALLRRAPVCLLDEPLANIDTPLRLQLRRDLRLHSQRFPATMIHVTHDPAEALAIGDQIAVMHDGRLAQIGSAADVLRRPANRFVAAYCRPQGPLNFLGGSLCQEDGDLVAVIAPWLRLAVPRDAISSIAGRTSVTVGIDGREVRILPAERHETAAGHTMSVEVAVTEFAPEGEWVTCRRDGVQITGLCEHHSACGVGMRVMLGISLERAFWFDATTGATLHAPAT